MILKHYFYLTSFAWLTSPDCVEALLKNIKKKWQEDGAPCPVALSSVHHSLAISIVHCATAGRIVLALQTNPANRIGPPKVFLCILLNSGAKSTTPICTAES